MIHGGELLDKTINIEMDYSVNLSPLGIPEELRDCIRNSVNSVGKYPEYSNASLSKSIAKIWNAQDSLVLCTSGASEAFLAIAHAIRPKSALVVSPSFYGYEYCLKAVDCEIGYYNLSEEDGFNLDEDIVESIGEDTDIIFLGYPNNPTGKAVSREALESILDRCHKMGTYIVLDICFYEMSDAGILDFSKLLAQYPELIVVNSFTKLFAIPGVRAGYIMCGRELSDMIKRQLPEWNVSSVASAAITKCIELLVNTDYVSDIRSYVNSERIYLTKELSELGIRVFDSDTAFLLVKSRKQIFDGLLEQKILIRKCDNFRMLGGDFYRIAVKSHEENIRFIEAVRSLSEGNG